MYIEIYCYCYLQGLGQGGCSYVADLVVAKPNPLQRCILLSGVNQEGMRNRTEPAKLNRTEPFNSGTGQNRTRKRTEPNRTEPRRVRKTQAELRRTGKLNCPNRTEPNLTEPMNCCIYTYKSGTKRIEPNRFLPGQ